MPTSYTLDEHLETFVQVQLASGRYNNASEVMSDALHLMEERERRLCDLDGAIERGRSDLEAGRVIDAETVFGRLEAKYASMAGECGKP